MAVSQAMRYEMSATAVSVSIVNVTKDDSGKITAEEVIRTEHFDAGLVPDVMQDGEKQKSLKVYGLTKLLQDRNSQELNPEDKLNGMKKYFEEFFVNGMWKAPSEGRASKPRAATIDTLLIQAVAEVQKISMAQATAALQALSAEERKNVMANPRITPVLERLRAEAASVDASALDGLL